MVVTIDQSFQKSLQIPHLLKLRHHTHKHNEMSQVPERQRVLCGIEHRIEYGHYIVQYVYATLLSGVCNT